MKRPQRTEQYSKSKMSLKLEVSESVKIAKELCYPTSVVDNLKECKTREDIDRVLTTARKRCNK